MANRIAHLLSTHGVVRDDPYFWMRDDARSDRQVLAYLDAENEHTERALAAHRAFRQELFEEIVARIPADDASVAVRRDGYWQYVRNEEGKEYDIHCRLVATQPEPQPGQGPVDEEQVILDENREARGHDYYAARGPAVSVNGKTMVFGEDTVSRRIYTLRFRDLESGGDLDDRIEGTTGEAVWALDDATVFYVKREPGTLRAHQVWRHMLGSDDDVLVYEESDPEFWLSVDRSRSREFILIGSFQTVTHEFRAVDARNPTTEARVILPRETGHEYEVDHAHGRFYIRTNWEARDFRLMSVAPDESDDKSNWRIEIPARENVLLRDFELFEDFVVAQEREEGIAGLRVIPYAKRTRGANAPWRLDTLAAHQLAFDEPVYVANLGDNSEFETHVLRLQYTSLTTPLSVFDYDMRERTRVLKKRGRVVGGFDPHAYRTERVYATARDGTRIPISLVYRADLDRSRPQPLLLCAYGSYGNSKEPTFASARLSLLDRGMIFAIAHVRGGQEMGRAWYDNGKLLHKKNTFYDYIDCAKHLIEAEWTDRDRLAGHGASAGGLLIGAVANMAPELFEALVADVPFVDVVTTMLDESIPLTTFEYDEWGNPNERAYFDYMMEYSPYDNVVAQAYPHMLVVSGLHDSQVQYWEPAKWVAKLRHLKTDDHQLLLHMNMEAGHGGASGRFRRHRETALIYTFLLDRLGMLR